MEALPCLLLLGLSVAGLEETECALVPRRPPWTAESPVHLPQPGEGADLGVLGLARLQQGLNGADALGQLGVLCPGVLELPVQPPHLLALALHLCFRGLQLPMQLCCRREMGLRGWDAGTPYCTFPGTPKVRCRWQTATEAVTNTSGLWWKMHFTLSEILGPLVADRTRGNVARES